MQLLNNWSDQRKSARVQIVLDVSGSMGDPGGGGETKLELAQRAAIAALDEFKDEDVVGLSTFTTAETTGETVVLDAVAPAPISANREQLRQEIEAQFPRYGTPLYEAIDDAFNDAVDDYDPELINAVVLLSDGVNEDLESSDDQQQLDQLLADLRRGATGENAKPIRVFPIAYGELADLDVLRRIAEATNSTVYDASDPTTITRVFTAVVSNF